MTSEGGPADPTLYQGQMIRNERLRLDGYQFIDCTLENCVLEFSGVEPFALYNTTMPGTRIEIAGPALGVLALLATMYRELPEQAPILDAMLSAMRRGELKLGRVPE